MTWIIADASSPASGVGCWRVSYVVVRDAFPRGPAARHRLLSGM